MSQWMSDFTSSFDSFELNVGLRSAKSRSKKLCSTCLSLCLNDCWILILQGLLNEILSSLSVLLGNLLLFNGICELFTEGKLSDWDIIDDNLEVLGTLLKSLTDEVRDLFSLGEKLTSVVLGDDWLEHFINDGWEYTLIVVRSESTVELGKLRLVRSVQHSQADVNHLEIFGTSDWLDDLRVGSHVVDDGSFKPWNQQMKTFLENLVANTRDLVELDSSVTSINCKKVLV